MRKRFLSCLMCAVLALSTAATVSAAETDDINSTGSYRDEFIQALLRSEDTWIRNAIDYRCDIQFIDLNFDGQLEFVPKYYMNTVDSTYYNATAFSSVYTLVNGSIVEVKTDNLDGYIVSDTLKGYYDKETNTYRLFGSCQDNVKKNSIGLQDNEDCLEAIRNSTIEVTDHSFVPQAYVKAHGRNFEVDMFSKKAENRYCPILYSQYVIKTKTADEGEETIYYTSEGEAITKEKYDSLNAEKVADLIDINMKYDSAFVVSDYQKLSNPEKKALLERLYDSFTYNKQNVSPDPKPIPVTKEYLAVELVDKSIPDIIDIFQGEYNPGSDYPTDRTTIDDGNQIHFIENQVVIPGMKFVSKYNTTNGFDKVIRSYLESGKYSLYAIQVTGSAKADKKINANMNYKDCSTALNNNFACKYDYLKTYNGKEPAVAYTYEDKENNALVTLNFELNSALKTKADNGQKSFTANEMSSANPKLKNIEVFKAAAQPTPNPNPAPIKDDDKKSPQTGIPFGANLVFAAVILGGAAAIIAKKRSELD